MKLLQYYTVSNFPPHPLYQPCVGAADLQAALTEFHQALDEVILGFSQQLQDTLTALGQGNCALPQVAQDAAKVLPTAVNQDPAWTEQSRAS